MKIFIISFMLFLSFFASAESSFNEKEMKLFESLNFINGPKEVRLNTKATIFIPEGYSFLNEADTKVFNQLSENRYVPGETVIISQDGWAAYFHYEETGYIKDDESLDADALLKVKSADQLKANKERLEKGWGILTLEGWYFKPRYDKKENLLEWGVILIEGRDNSQIINYETRILGRSGITNIILVDSPDTAQSSIVDLKKMLSNFSYVPGEKYTEFKEGDRIAEFGLAALVVGGAAAMASKKGFWAAIGAFFAAMWKIIVPILIIILAKIGSIIRWIKSIFTN
jgi:uncharacterized membrane-anchored protein